MLSAAVLVKFKDVKQISLVLLICLLESEAHSQLSQTSSKVELW